MVDEYIEQLESKIEQMECELGRVQIYQDYADEIIDMAAAGYEESRIGLKNCKKQAQRSELKGRMDAFEKMLYLVKKWIRAFDDD